MKEGSPLAKRIRALFWAALAVRSLSCIPSILDEDEAWFSASAAALAHPLRFFQSAVDNKPAGTVWFYWLVGKLAHAYPAPQLVRLASLVTIFLAARAVGRIARALSPAENLEGVDASARGELAALLTVVAASVMTPQALATTNEGLMLPWIAAAFALALAPWGIASALLAGACLGGAFLIKQTGMLFLPALLVCADLRLKGRNRPIRLLGIGAALGAGFALVVVPTVFAMGRHDFVYWTWTYSRQTLTAARMKIFSTIDWLSTFLVLAPFLAPLLALKFPRERAARRVCLAWGLSAAAAIALGHGLFYHYFLLLAPPLALAAAISQPRDFLRGWRRRWLTVSFIICVAIAAWPTAGLFWGTDLHYARELSKRIQQTTDPDERIWIWGGSAIPLAQSQRRHATSFLNGRFLVPPYTNATLRARFEAEFEMNPPALVIDLHERKDNRFDYRLETYPWIEETLRKSYFPAHDPTLPWATFYFPRGRKIPDPWLRGSDDGRALAQVWDDMSHLPPRSVSFPDTPKKLWEIERLSRLRMGVASLPARKRRRLERRLRAAWLEAVKSAPVSDYSLYEQKALDLFSPSSLESPFALQSRWWWVSWAIVKLQAGASSRTGSIP